MSEVRQKGSVNNSHELMIIDSTDGTPETGVVFDTSGIDLRFRRQHAAVVSITEIDLTTPALTDAHEDGGFLAIGFGSYRLDVPDAAYASGSDQVIIFGTVTGMVVVPVVVQLVDYDPFDAVRLGLTALPSAAADAVGGLPISDAGGLDLDAMNTAAIRLTAARAGALTDWIDSGRLDLLLDAIPTTAMRGTDNAALASVVGALADAAAAGDPTSADTVMQYVKQLVNVLVGAAGVVTFPAAAAPGNAVSLAEIIRAIYDDTTVIGAAGAGLTAIPFSTATITLPGQLAPPLTPTLDEAVGWLYKVLRNRKTQTSTLWALMADNESTVDAQATVSDDGTTAIKQEIVTGP